MTPTRGGRLTLASLSAAEIDTTCCRACPLSGMFPCCRCHWHFSRQCCHLPWAQVRIISFGVMLFLPMTLMSLAVLLPINYTSDFYLYMGVRTVHVARGGMLPKAAVSCNQACAALCRAGAVAVFTDACRSAARHLPTCAVLCTELVQWLCHSCHACRSLSGPAPACMCAARRRARTVSSWTPTRARSCG